MEADEEEAAEPEDPLQAERASLDEYDLGLYEIFNALLPPQDKKRLLPFPRLMQWPIAANGAISASCGAAAPSRHRRDSCPSHEVVGGLFFDFEAIRTESRDRDAPRRPS